MRDTHSPDAAICLTIDFAVRMCAPSIVVGPIVRYFLLLAFVFVWIEHGAPFALPKTVVVMCIEMSNKMKTDSSSAINNNINKLLAAILRIVAIQFSFVFSIQSEKNLHIVWHSSIWSNDDCALCWPIVDRNSFFSLLMRTSFEWSGTLIENKKKEKRKNEKMETKSDVMRKSTMRPTKKPTDECVLICTQHFSYANRRSANMVFVRSLPHFSSQIVY